MTHMKQMIYQLAVLLLKLRSWSLIKPYLPHLLLLTFKFLKIKLHSVNLKTMQNN